MSIIVFNKKYVKIVLKVQIKVNGKAQFGSKTERTRQYASILKRIATQPLALR